MLILCAIFIAFQAAVGFLFGQLFAGHFSLPATLAGCAGLASAAGAIRLMAQPDRPAPWVPWAAAWTLVGVVLDIGSHYLFANIAGNYYPWFLVGPYGASVAWVGYTALQRTHPADRHVGNAPGPHR